MSTQGDTQRGSVILRTARYCGWSGQWHHRSTENPEEDGEEWMYRFSSLLRLERRFTRRRGEEGREEFFFSLLRDLFSASPRLRVKQVSVRRVTILPSRSFAVLHRSRPTPPPPRVGPPRAEGGGFPTEAGRRGRGGEGERKEKSALPAVSGPANQT